MRKYEYETGRFISIDPLWGSYYGWTPYQYSMNSPVMLVDINGKLVENEDGSIKYRTLGEELMVTHGDEIVKNNNIYEVLKSDYSITEMRDNSQTSIFERVFFAPQLKKYFNYKFIIDSTKNFDVKLTITRTLDRNH